MRIRTLRTRQIACMVMLAGTISHCWAWTDKPVRVVVPAPAGGLMDAMARLLSDQLGSDLGQPVIVDNRPGAGGYIGIRALLSSPPDGQTIMVTASNVLTEIPLVLKTNFEPLTDIKPVASVGIARLVLVASSDLPARDFKGLVSYVKGDPEKQSYASYSTGTASHYGGVMLNQKLGLNMQHVPFAGAPPALVQVMGKQVTMMFDNIPNSLPLIQAGKLRPYAVTSKNRSGVLPQVPTFEELGYPDIDFTNWVGVVVSSKVPNEMAEKIRAAVAKAAASSKVRERLVAMGYEPSPAQSMTGLADATRAEYARNASIVKTFNIHVEQ